MINKQNLWFITLFSLILVLGIYYVSMGDETVKVLAGNNDVSEVLETIEQNNRIYQDVINENKKLHQSYEELRTQVEMLTKQKENLRRQNMQYKEGFNHIKSVLTTPNTVENVSVNEKVM